MSNRTGINWNCHDCKKDCSVDDKDYFMVTHKLWETHGVGKGLLCMGCMEERIGHPLRPGDIHDCPLNEYINPYTKAIIKNQ